MKICVRCGAKLKDEETFCSRCGGTNFKEPQPVKKQAQHQQQSQQAQQPQMQQNMNNMNMNMQGMQPNMNMNMQGMQMNGMNGMQPNMNMNNMNMNGMQMNPNMMMQQNMGINPNMMMQQNMGMQQQNNGKKSLFKSPKQKKADMQAEMEMMRQMQQQKQMQQMQQGGNTANTNVKPGQKQSNASLFQNNQFTDAEPDMNVQDWLKTLLLLVIPIFNIVYIIKGMNEPMYPPYRQNFLKAFGIYYGAGLAISIIVSIILTVTTL